MLIEGNEMEIEFISTLENRLYRETEIRYEVEMIDYSRRGFYIIKIYNKKGIYQCQIYKRTMEMFCEYIIDKIVGYVKNGVKYVED